MVDHATMRRLPWIDFDSIIDNTESSRRQQVIFDLLQNNLPNSADDIYYIYHDENTNTFSNEVDETSEEIQNFIGSIMLIDAKLEVEDLSDKEGQTLIRKRKIKIKELEKTYGAKVAANLLEKRMTLEEKKEIEEEIIRMQTELNKDRDEYYHIFNKETGEFELRLDQDIDLMHQIVGAIIKLDEKYEIERTENNKRINRRLKKKFIAKLRELGADDLADSLMQAMEKIKRTKNLYNGLKEDEESVFSGNDKITKQLIKKAKKSSYEKDKVFMTFYKNLGDVNIQAEEVVIPTYVSFVEKKEILTDLHCLVLVDPLSCYMQTLQASDILLNQQQILIIVSCLLIYLPKRSIRIQ